MDIVLDKKPKNPVIIEGFPGFGLVGTITTEFLITELKAKLIGNIRGDEIPPLVAVHEGELLRPMGIYYAEKQNLVILHIMTNITGIEWDVSKKLLEVANQLQAKEIICIEGVGTPMPTENTNAYYYSNNESGKKRFEAAKIPPLKEGIILGVTATVLLQAAKEKISCIFTETHSSLPDSKAAAKAIEVIDKYIGLKVKYEPLLEQAEKFEAKIKGLLQQGEQASAQQVKKQMSYVG